MICMICMICMTRLLRTRLPGGICITPILHNVYIITAIIGSTADGPHNLSVDDLNDTWMIYLSDVFGSKQGEGKGQGSKRCVSCFLMGSRYSVRRCSYCGTYIISSRHTGKPNPPAK